MTAETFPGDITQTRMSDRDLIIHAVQHLEDQAAQLEEIRGICAELAAELAVFRPLLREIAPDGKVSLGGLLRARRGAKPGPVNVQPHERIWGG